MQHKYPSIENFYKNASDLFDLPVTISEKIDGSNFSILMQQDGTYEIRSRSNVLQEDNKQFSTAIQLFKMIKDGMHEVTKEIGTAINWVFEYYGKGVNNRIAYDLRSTTLNINDKSLILIDACIIYPNHLKWLPLVELNTIAGRVAFTSKCDLSCPKTLWLESFKPECIQSIRTVSGDFNWLKEREGAVVRLQDRNKKNLYGELIQCKIKTEWYDKVESGDDELKVKSVQNAPLPEAVAYIQENINFARLNSIYSHGHQELNYEMADMKFLPKFIIEDLKTEKNPLWDTNEKDLTKVLGKYLPKVLNKWLATSKITDATFEATKQLQQLNHEKITKAKLDPDF